MALPFFFQKCEYLQYIAGFFEASKLVISSIKYSITSQAKVVFMARYLQSTTLFFFIDLAHQSSTTM